MSTPNFCYDNVLIVMEDGQLEFFQELGKSLLVEDLKKAIPVGGASDRYLDNNRSYGGRALWEVDIATAGGELYKTITVLVRDGYYGGANIDYIVTEGETERVIKELDKKVDGYCKKIVKILKNYGTELACVGIFSNGEAVYKIKK